MNKLIIIGASLLILGTTLTPTTYGSPTFYSSNNGGDDGETEYWAVIVTILDYEIDVNDLPEDKIIIDRYRIYNATLSAKNWKNENVKFLTNENATKNNITDALMWLQNNTDADDILFFFFNGHGGTLPDDNGDEKDGKDEIICPYDTNINEDGELINFITDDELDEYFDQINVKGMFIVFESCHSGGLIDGRSTKIDGMKKLDCSREFNEELTTDIDDTNRVILASSKEQKVSTMSSGVSLFLTYALNPSINQSDDKYVYALNLGFLGITADKNKDGLITAEEISKFVKKRVTILWSFLLLCPIFKTLLKIQLIRVYRKVGQFPSIIPQVYDGYKGELPIIEL